MNNANFQPKAAMKQFNKMKNFPNIIQSQHSSKANSRNINRGSGSGITGPGLGAKTFYA